MEKLIMSFRVKSSLVVVAVLQMLLMTSSVAQPSMTSIPVGRISSRDVEAIVAGWNGTAAPSGQRLAAYRRLRGGATVRVFLGAWCDDSKDEVSKFMNLVDVLGAHPPFAVEYFGVDRKKQEPAREIRSNDIRYLPTFVVIRNGHEVGRIVEHPPNNLDDDLLHLLNGSAKGLLSSNEDAIASYLTGASAACCTP
jgi:hypothetical protein